MRTRAFSWKSALVFEIVGLPGDDLKRSPDRFFKAQSSSSDTHGIEVADPGLKLSVMNVRVCSHNS